MSEASTPFPRISQTVIDATDVRALAEFYRQLFGLVYRPGDEADSEGHVADWLVLRDPDRRVQLAFQQVPDLPRPAWPDGEPPQMMHLDTTVPDLSELELQRQRAMTLGATLLLDRSDDEEEALYVFADPAGHPFCIFVSAPD
ncbi:VOC family protein [Ruania halotolerans]|uniref:VOC family protein n=1 Tax=Ruania halotolerans TaxID=2897773 RepID=UPI001E5F5C68|nr:VOC family protein [Ruania halotolerans]UFU05427.1 VOC family protein [Ruania halotolerans]